MKYLLFLMVFCTTQIFAKNCMIFKKTPSDSHNETMYDLNAYITDCGQKIKKVATYGYWGDNPKLNYYLFKRISGVQRLFISIYVYTDIYEEKPKYVYDEGKYHFTFVYDCIDFTCKPNQKMTAFLGDGGDLVEAKNYKLIWSFPYANVSALQNELDSKFFQSWLTGQLKSGTVKNKTEIYQDSDIREDHMGYLIAGDQFRVKGVRSKWLNVVYTSKNNQTIQGWIACKDTNLCH